MKEKLIAIITVIICIILFMGLQVAILLNNWAKW